MIVVIGGPSGSGKSTVGQILEQAAGWTRVVTITTREPRPGERDGVDYYFLSPEEFRAADRAGVIGEKTKYIGNGLQYGIYHQDLREALERLLPSYVITDAEGLCQLRRYYGPGKVVGVYLTGSRDVLVERMAARGDDELAIYRRLQKYDKEMSSGLAFEHRISTDALTPEAVAQQLLHVVMTPIGG